MQEKIHYFQVNNKLVPVQVIFDAKNNEMEMQKIRGFYILRISYENFNQNLDKVNDYVQKFIGGKAESSSWMSPGINLENRYFYFLSKRIYFQYSNFNKEIGFEINDGKTFLACKNETKIGKTLHDWLQNELLKIVSEMINSNFLKFFLTENNLKNMQINIKHSKSYWGRNKAIDFNTKTYGLDFNIDLIMFDEKLIESVVFHELTHCIYRNHSKQFWNHLTNILPDIKLRNWYLNHKKFKYKTKNETNM